ncbi:hypothetical protein ACI78T_03900 [Blastococcus sp. SYSU D00922]
MDPVEAEQPGDVRTGTRWLLVAFTVLTLLAVLQLLLLADVADRYWAWTIRTELTAAFLGAAYGGGFVLSVVALRQREWNRIRLPVITVAAFTWLTAVATLIHLHRLHLVDGGPVARVVAWVWLAVYLVVPVACLLVVLAQERRRVRVPALRPMSDGLTVALAVEGAMFFAAGVLLFAGGMTVHHDEPRSAAAFWPWELTPLSAQVIGAWLIALGVAAALALVQGDVGRQLVAATTYTAFGVFEFVAVAWYWPQLNRHDAWLWVYLTFLAAVVLTGALGVRAARRGAAGGADAAPAPTPRTTTTAGGRPAA